MGSSLFRARVQNEPCPICGKVSWSIQNLINFNKPLFGEYDNQNVCVCLCCGSKWTEEEWDELQKTKNQVEQTIPDEPEAVNLLIFENTVVNPKFEKIEKFRKDLLEQIREGVVILPPQVKFVGAFNYVTDAELLYFDDKIIMMEKSENNE